MDEISLATRISEKVISDTQFWIAIVGIIGGVVGALITLFSNMIFHWFTEKPQRELDNLRTAMLKKMLNDDRFPEKWRNLSTMSAVVGASDEETKRLLIKTKARGSEKADGKWGLIKKHPFPDAE